jgi:hypothetical protein
MKIKDRAMEYFKLFEESNLSRLSEIYHERIHLIDWNGEWSSKRDVLEMNKSLFNNNKISVKIIELHEIDNRAYCKIEIKINDEILKVMDVVDFSQDGKITKIEAYKG